MTEKFYSVAETAAKLGRSTRTIYRYIHSNVFPGLVVIRRPARNQYFFTDRTISAFLTSRNQDVQASGKPAKRIYRRKTRRRKKHAKSA